MIEGSESIDFGDDRQGGRTLGDFSKNQVFIIFSCFFDNFGQFGTFWISLSFPPEVMGFAMAPRSLKRRCGAV